VREVSLFGKRETEKLKAAWSFILSFEKGSRNSFLFLKRNKTSNDTCNLLLFSTKEKRKINALLAFFFIFVFALPFYFLATRHAKIFFAPAPTLLLT
jgi:hypothetical protein